MATQVRRRQTLYGYPQPQTGLQQEPLVFNRTPTSADSAELGTIWVDYAAPSAYILVQNNGGINGNVWQLLESSGGAGVFSSLLVNPGPVTTQGTGAVNISADAVATTVNIATGGAAKAVTVGSTNTSSATTIQGGTGKTQVLNNANVAGAITIETNGGTTETILIENNAGTSASSISISSTAGGISINGDLNLSLAGGGDITVAPATGTAASPTASITSNVNLLAATFTGFTTAAAGTQAFTITSSKILATSGIFVTVCNSSAGNDAQMTLTGVTQAVGSIVVHTTNNGTQALDSTVYVNVWIIS